MLRVLGPWDVAARLRAVERTTAVLERDVAILMESQRRGEKSFELLHEQLNGVHDRLDTLVRSLEGDAHDEQVRKNERLRLASIPTRVATKLSNGWKVLIGLAAIAYTVRTALGF